MLETFYLLFLKYLIFTFEVSESQENWNFLCPKWAIIKIYLGFTVAKKLCPKNICSLVEALPPGNTVSLYSHYSVWI